jgi:hypothetical protein
MRLRKSLVAALVAALMVATVGPMAADGASPRSYKNCKALNNVYPHGVGRKGARDRTSDKRVRNFKVSNKVYAYNDGKAPRHRGERDLDRDNDGIACEKS